MQSFQIIPAILATSEKQFEADSAKLNAQEGLKNGWVHIDFADNIFVQNQTITPELIQKYPLNLRKEAHLMVVKPKDWIDSVIKSGFERVIIHLEAKAAAETIEYAKSKRLEVGLAIKSETDITNLEPLINKVNIILIMSIVPGFQGQPFILDSLKKIGQLKKRGWKIKIGVDGAVKDDNIKDIIKAGADFVIVGSYLLKGDTKENLEILWESINGA